MQIPRFASPLQNYRICELGIGGSGGIEGVAARDAPFAT